VVSQAPFEIFLVIFSKDRNWMTQVLIIVTSVLVDSRANEIHKGIEAWWRLNTVE